MNYINLESNGHHVYYNMDTKELTINNQNVEIPQWVLDRNNPPSFEVDDEKVWINNCEYDPIQQTFHHPFAWWTEFVNKVRSVFQ